MSIAPNQNEIKRVVVKPFSSYKFELVKDYFFYSNVFKTYIVIPKGYKTNGANIPRIFWSIYPPYKCEYLSAVVIHDYLCDKSLSKTDYEFADKIFKEALERLQVNIITIKIFYISVSVFHKLKCLFKGIK